MSTKATPICLSSVTDRYSSIFYIKGYFKQKILKYLTVTLDKEMRVAFVDNVWHPSKDLQIDVKKIIK